MKKALSLILRILIIAAAVAAQTLACFCILRLNMLPPVLVAALITAVVLLSGGLGVLLFVRKRGGKVGWVRTVIAAVLTVILAAGCLFASSMAAEFYDAMQQITNVPKPNAERNIYVLADDPAQTIADAADYTFGTVSGYDEHCTKQVLTALETEFSAAPRVQEFASVTDMLDALYEKQVDAVILNGGYLSILEEDSRYVLFGEETRVLYTVPVVEEGDVELPAITPETESNISNTPFVLYLSGQDGYAQNLAVSRSDVNILMVVNPNTKQILMINTPRDYYVVHPWGSGARDKLTHCGIYGIDCSIKALEGLYGVEINYYAQINFEGFKKLIDEIGGITVYSDKTFTDGSSQIVAGINELNGEEALCFARDRYHQEGGDNGRGKNQMKVIQAVIEKVTTGNTFIKKYAAIFDSLDGMFATSVTIDQISQLARMQLADMASWNIRTFAVSGYGDTRTTYSMPGTNAYVMHPDQKSVDYASELIQRVVDGDILSAEDMTLPQ